MPYWRDHNSLKGWCSMNYPCTVTNPTIKRKPPSADEEKEKQEKLFSNQERPVSCPDVRLSRPFSSKLHQGGLVYKPFSAAQMRAEDIEDINK